MRTIIEKQHFSGVHNSRNLDFALVLDCVFTDAEMQGAMLSGAVFIRCRFTTVSLYWASMFQTVFLDCSFTDVEFRGASMEEALFMRCSLERCDFSRDNLGGETNLSTVTFTDSERNNCRYESNA